ncbi:hypothetical protein [Luteimonas huabeiensis]|uniref:hypothetical protein n=1 Tax=Luteimonas huabeiensis TaxID=1244513 RepID=UPI0004B62C44|nr:hypothetical protein [Luteimonas huabeiensis]
MAMDREPGQIPAHDWDRFVARHWARSPSLTALDAAPLGTVDAFDLVREIARPFRAGMRFFMLPALRFRVGDVDIRAPGDLLPDDGDATAGDYLRRLDARLSPDAPWLEIEQPLVADPAAWAAVRSVLQGLWDRVGCPLQPIAASLTLGRYVREWAPDASVLLLPLHGEVRVRIAPPGADGGAVRDWSAGPGHLVYWPAGWRARERSERALALQLRVPQAPAALVEEVRDLAIGMLQPALYPDGATPMFPAEPAREPGGGAALPEPLQRLVRELPAFAQSPDLETALRVKWAGRCSACALEPVPPRGQPPPLRDEDRVGLAPGVRIVAMPVGAGMEVWAVNGHAVGVPASAAGDALRRRLEAGGRHRVADLCGAPGHDPALRLALDRLHAARGVALERTYAAPAARVEADARG